MSNGVQIRDLWVSPEHALYLDGRLVPARLIVNGVTIGQVEAVERLEYFHIELDTHDIIFAEGAAAETCVDCDNRGMFQNNREFAALYPDHRPMTWHCCAPARRTGSEELATIRMRLLTRTRDLGRLTRDPSVHLIIDGETLPATEIAGRTYRFAIPAGARDIAIASRSAMPAEVEAASCDVRRLGVAIEEVVLRAAGCIIKVAPDCPALRNGFYSSEITCH